MLMLKTIQAVVQLFFVWVAVIALVAVEEVDVDTYLYSAAATLTLVELCLWFGGLRTGNNNDG